MSAVARLDMAKLAAVLGMMGSEHDGEALSAARTAERLRRHSGLAWADLLRETPAWVPPEPRPAPHIPARLGGAVPAAAGFAHRVERAFVRTLARCWQPPSARPMDVLCDIAAKVAAP